MKYVSYSSGLQNGDVNKQASENLSARGSVQRPLPPRGLIATSGVRKILVTWELPVVYKNIAGWRVYRNTENELYDTIRDIGNRQADVAVTAGATPPVVAVYVSSITANGAESPKIQVLGSAIAEAGAPTEASAPTSWASSTSGGSIQTREKINKYYSG